ncbi:MAG: LamG domain-containing protein [Bacteroidales bacterium]|nr:LamG domain-containing protein [Bacteroidales bacterium]
MKHLIISACPIVPTWSLTFTISAWIFTETDYGYGQVVQKNRDIIQGHYGLYVNGIGANVCYTCNNGAGFQENPVIGQWHMVTGTISVRDARFYQDGELIALDTLDFDYVYSGTDPMAIGMHYYEGVPDFWTYPYRGKIDDILIYNRVLSAEEVACLYSGDCSSLKLSASLTDDQLCKGGVHP